MADWEVVSVEFSDHGDKVDVVDSFPAENLDEARKLTKSREHLRHYPEDSDGPASLRLRKSGGCFLLDLE